MQAKVYVSNYLSTHLHFCLSTMFDVCHLCWSKPNYSFLLHWFQIYIAKYTRKCLQILTGWDETSILPFSAYLFSSPTSQVCSKSLSYFSWTNQKWPSIPPSHHSRYPEQPLLWCQWLLWRKQRSCYCVEIHVAVNNFSFVCKFRIGWCFDRLLSRMF